MPVLQTVFVVDDNSEMRTTLGHFLKAAQLNVEVFDSAKGFLNCYSAEMPGCLVLDIKMPEMSGLDLQSELSLRGAMLPVIFVTGEAAVMDAVRAMKQGSFEFIEKPYSPEFLLQRIREALSHDQKTRAERTLRGEFAARYNQLTSREKKILSSVVSGQQSKFIADQMGVSVSTIDNHRANIMRKLKAETAADLTRIALIVDPSLAFQADD